MSCVGLGCIEKIQKIHRLAPLVHSQLHLHFQIACMEHVSSLLQNTTTLHLAKTQCLTKLNHVDGRDCSGSNFVLIPRITRVTNCTAACGFQLSLSSSFFNGSNSADHRPPRLELARAWRREGKSTSKATIETAFHSPCPSDTRELRLSS